MQCGDYFVETSRGGYLDALAKMHAFSREHYGIDWMNKPNDHCYWDNGILSGHSYGWNETDAHMKLRIMEVI